MTIERALDIVLDLAKQRQNDWDETTGLLPTHNTKGDYVRSEAFEAINLVRFTFTPMVCNNTLKIDISR